jgi:hypothetical protein
MYISIRTSGFEHEKRGRKTLVEHQNRPKKERVTMKRNAKVREGGLAMLEG